jgi:hypothetical protein
MTEKKEFDTNKLARPWLNNMEPQSVAQSYTETPTLFRVKTSEPSQLKLVGGSIGIAFAVTALVTLGLVLIFGVKV